MCRWPRVEPPWLGLGVSLLKTVVASREFKVQDGWSWAPKLGLAISSLEYRENPDATRWKARTEVTYNPVATLELGKSITDRLSWSADYTRHFTDERELNNSIKLGIRLRF